MIAKTGLLVVTNPKHIGKILPQVQEKVKNTLYIHLTSALKPFGVVNRDLFATIPKYSQTIRVIYSEAVRHCKDLDVRILLSSLKYSSVNRLNTLSKIEVVIFDKLHEKNDIDTFIKTYVNNITEKYSVLTLDTENGNHNENSETEKTLCKCCKTYQHVVLGGTFDRLHIGHKMLLTEAILRSTQKVTVGVTDTNMLSGKTLWELIEPCQTRMNSVTSFVNDICSELNYEIVPIQDPFGPTKTGEDMEMIVVSAETVRGGEKVNEIRQKNGLQPLDMYTVELVDCPDRQEDEEEKISSSTNRMRILGCPIKEINVTYDGSKPYVIGLTGGIASGKSSISQRLLNLGAAHIDCDKVAHELYKKGKPCHSAIRETFGEKVIGEDGEINRRVLGGIVFGNKDEMQKLNNLVWPLIANEVQNQISNFHSEGKKIVVIEAAVLVQAGWSEFCDEVWTSIIPPEEAIIRLKNRNNLSEDEAKARLSSQISNIDHVKSAHVVLCTLWSYEYTQSIVERAWNCLLARLHLQSDLNPIKTTV